MNKKEEQRIRDLINLEKFKYDINKTSLITQFSLISIYTFGIAGIIIAFVAAFKEIWWHALILTTMMFVIFAHMSDIC